MKQSVIDEAVRSSPEQAYELGFLDDMSARNCSIHKSTGRIGFVCCLLGLAGLLTGCAEDSSLDQHVVVDAPESRKTELAVPGDDWPRFGGNWKEDHYSPLVQVNEGNVGDLKLAWFFDLPTLFSSGVSAPLEVDGVLYFAVGHSIIHALAANSGDLLWKHDPRVHEVAGHKMRAGFGVRGIAYHDSKILTGTLDGRLLALDADDGSVLWSVDTTEGPEDGRYITGQPYVMDGKVIIGHGGGDYQAVRGYVTAYDIQTGTQAWRFHLVPGNPAEGFENDAMAMAAKTWTGEWWKFGGGGTAWSAMAYDAELNRIYVGTGNGVPWNQKIRSPAGGDNLFLCSVVALDAATGDYIWHYQFNPGETWDFNAAMPIQLADIELDGETRKVLFQAPKNGFFYVIDRVTGKFISAEPFAKVNWAEGIDPVSGRPMEVPAARYPGGTGYLMFPSAAGAHNVQAAAFNHDTNLVYLPARDIGMVYADAPDLDSWKHEGIMVLSSGLGAPEEPIQVPPGRGWLAAWDPVDQREAWRIDFGALTSSGGVLTTAGNLVFHGNARGELVAYAADSGRQLWVFDAQNGIMSHPMTYLADGKQYISLLVGWRGTTYPGQGERWYYRQQKRRVLTFALDILGTTLPEREQHELPVLDDPDFEIDPERAAEGLAIYTRNCHVCHGYNMDSWGGTPDLLRSPMTLSVSALESVLIHGALKAAGMPQYEEMPRSEIESLQHYIRKTSRESMN